MKGMTVGTQPVALITGASSGIGQATAELFAANRFRVFGTSRTPDDRTSRNYTMLPLDVCVDESVDAAVREVLDRTGRIDVLVNNAGYAQSGALEENSIAEAQAQFDTNLFGVMRVTKAVAPVMRQQGGGHIINVSSVLGQIAFPYVGLYAASKFALEGFTEALRHELRQFNIQVALVEPGFVKTNFAGQRPASQIDAYASGRQAAFQRNAAGIQRGMQPNVVAQAILSVATTSAPHLRNRVGRTSRLLSILKRLLPERIFERVQRRIFEASPAPVHQPQPHTS
jgi:short-subunit dehydrogenase